MKLVRTALLSVPSFNITSDCVKISEAIALNGINRLSKLYFEAWDAAAKYSTNKKLIEISLAILEFKVAFNVESNNRFTFKIEELGSFCCNSNCILSLICQ